MTHVKYILIVLFATLLFSQCQNDTGLTTNQFKTKAVIQGNVYYSLGQDYTTDGFIVDKRVIAAEKKIYLDIESSEYKSGSEGIITYETTIDTLGNYKFEIPIKVKGNTTASLRLEQFVDTRKVYDGMDNGRPTYKSEEAVFSSKQDVSISNGQLLVKNIQYSFSPVNLPDSYKEYIEFKGTLNIAYEKGFRDGAFKGAANRSVEVAVSYPMLSEQLHFGAAVDASGSYTIRIPVQSKTQAIVATFSPVGFLTNDYTHYSSSSTQTRLNGTYSSNRTESVQTISGNKQTITYTVSPMDLFFHPENTPETWEGANLAGWVRLNPSIYRYEKTINGNVFSAIEKSYLVGDYSPISGKTITAIVNMGSGYLSQTYIVSTNSDGSFSIPIKLPNQNMDINLTIGVETYGITDYKHYLSSGSSISLKGWYASDYYSLNNFTLSVNEFNNSYTLPSLYRKFSPLNEESISTWRDNLFGWYQIRDKKTTISLSGMVKKAVEGSPNTRDTTNWQVANWANTASQPFTIYIQNTAYVGITSTSGQYNLTVPINIEFEDGYTYTYRVGPIVSGIDNITNFIHYSKWNASPITIQGSYYGEVPLDRYPIVDGVCTLKDCYMYFTPSVVPTGWNGYQWRTN